MKKALHWIMAVLAVFLVVVCLASEMADFSADLLISVGGIVLLAVFVFYAWRYAGVRCPSCGCRINGKYGRKTAFEGRFRCPKCGAMIEL